MENQANREDHLRRRRILQQQIREAVPAIAARRQRFSHLLAGLNPTVRWLLFSDILIGFCERIHFAWVVIYAMNDLGMTGTQMGILVAVEVGVAIACYLPASFLADRFGREPFVIGTFVLFTLSPVTLLFADSFAGVLLAFAVMVCGSLGTLQENPDRATQPRQPARASCRDLLSRSRHAGGLGFHPGCGPVSVPAAGKLPQIDLWRLGWDSNPRGARGIYKLQIPRCRKCHTRQDCRRALPTIAHGLNAWF